MTTTPDVQKLADILGETEAKPLADLARIVEHIGIDDARTLVDKAKQVESQGGMQRPDGQPRPLGGIFFKLARERLPYTEPPLRFRKMVWTEAAELAHKAAKEPSGEATTVKITLIGRPGKLERRNSVVVTTMHNSRRPALPKQLPKLSGQDVETKYTVYIAAKQWRKVAEAMKDRDDILIIEGYCFLDSTIPGIGVFAQSTTTKNIQRALREKQRAEAATKSD